MLSFPITKSKLWFQTMRTIMNAKNRTKNSAPIIHCSRCVRVFLFNFVFFLFFNFCLNSNTNFGLNGRIFKLNHVISFISLEKVQYSTMIFQYFHKGFVLLLLSISVSKWDCVRFWLMILIFRSSFQFHSKWERRVWWADYQCATYMCFGVNFFINAQVFSEHSSACISFG